MGNITVSGLDIGQVRGISVAAKKGDGLDATYDGKILTVPGVSPAKLQTVYDDYMINFRRPKIMWYVKYGMAEGITPTLDERKMRSHVVVKEGFTADTKSGFTCTNGITFDADLTDIQRLRSGHELAANFNQPAMDIRDYNNVVHSAVPLAEVWTMLEELGVNYQTLLAKKWVKEAAIDAATTTAEVEAVTW